MTPTRARRPTASEVGRCSNSPSGAAGLWWLASLALLAACQQPAPTRAPSEPPTAKLAAPAVAPTARATTEDTSTATDDTATVPAKPPPTHLLRLLLRPPPDFQPRDISAVTATVRVDQREVARDLPAAWARDVHEGLAVVVAVIGAPPDRASLTGARALIGRLGPWDRVAVGVVDASGWRLLRNFSADMAGAAAALTTIKPGPSHKEEPIIPFWRGLQQALDVFRGRTGLPNLRAMVLMGDGQDKSLRRSSLLKQAMWQVQARAHYHGVEIHVIGVADPGHTDTNLARLRGLTESSGGVWHGPVRRTHRVPGTVSTAWRQTADALHDVLAFDLALPETPSGAHEVSLTIGHGSHAIRRVRRLAIHAPGGRRYVHNMEIPPAPTRVLPVGVDPSRDLAAEASAADTAGRPVLAGALWHLLCRASPENRTAREQAALADKAHRKGGFHEGHFVANGKLVDADCRTVYAPNLLPEVWQDDLGEERSAGRVLRQRSLPPEDKNNLRAPRGDPPIQQVVLGRCAGAGPKACLRTLLSQGRATHFFIAADGAVTQVADTDHIVRGGAAVEGAAIYVQLAMPPLSALSFQLPGRPNTWRQPRRYVSEVNINASEESGFGPTPAQYDALIPLLSALADHYPDLQPVVPIDLQHRETFAALLHPADFKGIVCTSNLDRKITRDPGPGLDLKRLNHTVRRWIWRSTSADMEVWVRDFAHPRKRLGAVARFAAVGETALPLLAEVSQQLPPAEALWAVRAIGRIGSPVGAPALARVAVMADPQHSEGLLALHIAALEGLVVLGTPAERASMMSLLARLDATKGAKSPAGLTLRRLTQAVLAATAETPADLEALAEALDSPDSVMRAQAAVTWISIDPEGASERLSGLREDPQPWIRLLAARAQGPSGLPAVLALHEQLPIAALLPTVLALSPKEPVPATLRWFDDATAQDRLALGDLYIAWRWPDAVYRLAPRLKNPAERPAVHRILKAITGRDFGRSSPDGWRAWRPAPTR